MVKNREIRKKNKLIIYSHLGFQKRYQEHEQEKGQFFLINSLVEISYSHIDH